MQSEKNRREDRRIRRGDLYYYDFGKQEGSIQNGRRPVLVLQADDFNQKAPTILVAAVTTVIKKRYLPSHVFLGADFGLSRPSMALLEQIRAVNKDRLEDYIGSIDEEACWIRINAALKKTFGLWFYNKERSGDIRCLCPKCLHDYMTDSNYVVRRLDPLSSSKDTCDKCSNMGYDYMVYDKRMIFREKGKRV